MTPATRGTGAQRQAVTREGPPGSSLTQDLPGAGGVGESRLGRRDPRDAQAEPPRDGHRPGVITIEIAHGEEIAVVHILEITCRTHK